MLALQCIYNNFKKNITFAGRCTQGGTHQWESTKKIQVKHDLGRRLYGGQGKKEIGGAHLLHVGIAMHAWSFCWKGIVFAGRCTQSGTPKVWRTDRRTEGRTDGQSGSIMSRRSYWSGHKNSIWIHICHVQIFETNIQSVRRSGRYNGTYR